jgi:ElaB/YqjD/DUF883 family membrane-anchored ribosome-binding protein
MATARIRHGYCDLAEGMTAERIDSNSQRKPKAPTAAQSNGNSGIKSRDFVRRAKTLVSEWPSNLDAQMKHRPYTTLGVALAIGVGAGVLLGSRILRSVVVTAVSCAAVEIGRKYLLQTVAGSWGIEKSQERG